MIDDLDYDECPEWCEKKIKKFYIIYCYCYLLLYLIWKFYYLLLSLLYYCIVWFIVEIIIWYNNINYIL